MIKQPFMQIIPVMDLKDGLVVHALRGDREQYRPIHQSSQITGSSDIDAVLSGFLQLYPFKRFYIADLNAITGTGNHQALIDNLLLSYPDIDFWVDNGRQLSEINTHPANLKWVIGTESQQLPPSASTKDFILSLDYKNQQAAGHDAWFKQADFWPDSVIAMTLNRVGGSMGPDIEKLTELQQSHPGKQWIAAGGVRNLADLVLLKKNGIHAALLATALHNGSITGQIIQSLQAKKYPGKPRYFRHTNIH